MANVENYGWAYIHPTASQAQARGVNQAIQFMSGSPDSNGIASASGSANLIFDYDNNQLVLTGNMTASNHISASTFYGDGSNLTGINTGSGFPFTGAASISGSLNVIGPISASHFLIQNVIELEASGSTNFGNTDDDLHEFTGSVKFASSGSDPDFHFNNSVPNLKVPALRVPYRTTGSAAFSASTTDYIIGVSNVTSVVIELPSAATVGTGSLLVIKDEVSGTRTVGNAITISASSGDTVDNASSTTLAGSMTSKTFYSDGSTKWFII